MLMRMRMGVCAAVLLTGGLLIGCGGGSYTPPSNPTPPAITGTITGAPASLAAGGTASITATVSNDSTNAGVDWTCTTTPCGSFNPTHTASGAATTFTAPSAAGTVTIIATSTASGKSIATSSITITAPTAVSLALGAAPASLNTNGTTSLTATVTNDSTNAGVDWTCTPIGSCGGFNPAHTASGAATTFTAPGTAGSVTVTATATASSAATQSATISIATGTSVANLNGTFAFGLTGHEASTHGYALAGSIVLDGNGNVTSGKQDYNNGHGTLSPQISGGDTITGGTYTVGSDGRGTLSLVTNNAALGASGTENFSLVLVNSKHALLIQDDASGTAAGSMDMQTIAGGLGQVSGNYSFTVAGVNSNNTEVFGGKFSSAGAGALTAIVVDSSSNGTVSHGTNTGTYTAADTSGRGTIFFGGVNFVYYAVGPEALRLIVVNTTETDSGWAFGQGAGPFSASSLTGSFVFKNSSAETGAASFVSAGQLTTDGAGNISSGFADVDEAGTVTSAAVAGTYTMAANGVGTITITPGNSQNISALGVYAIDPAINPLDPNSASGGGGALILDLDPTEIGGGVLLAQAGSPGAFQGNYAVNYRGFTTAGAEQNLVGQIAVNNLGVVTGNADGADLGTGSPHLNVALTGTVTADTLHTGRFTLPVSNAFAATPPALNFAVYQASTGDLLWVETDSGQYASGTIEQQQ